MTKKIEQENEQQNPTHKCSWIVEKYFGTIKPRDLEFAIPVPQLAGLLAHSFTRAAAFPITQWHIGNVFLHTVTRSHRLLTCFPILRNHLAAPIASYLVFK